MSVVVGLFFFVLQNLRPKYRPKIGSLISDSILNYTENNETEPCGCTQHIAEMRLFFFFGGHFTNVMSVWSLSEYLDISCKSSAVYHTRSPGFV